MLYIIGEVDKTDRSVHTFRDTTDARFLAKRRDRDSNPGDNLSEKHPFHENERNTFIFSMPDNFRNFSGSNAVLLHQGVVLHCS